MEFIFICRLFVVLPCWFILLFLSIISVVRCLKNKCASFKSKLVPFIFISITVITAYFIFIHGNVRKTTINIENCINSFDKILALNMEKQDEPYLFSENGEHYYTKKSFNNIQAEIHVIYGKMNPSFDITETYSNAFEYIGRRLLSKNINANGITCTASVMHAGKEELFGVHAFNGSYSGCIYMQREDINIVIDYVISDEIIPIYAFTTVKPSNP